ncbi:LysM peptidoglycan-binding domain-containing protein [Mesobacillus maritimus]|uniref:LysM peptidoglycan-binding domain-containing protein n=1 Tax=Mesobacillus maritimus TaxID=1643336 RepID=UPI00384A634D
MVEINHYELVHQEHGNFTLFIYLDPQLSEFSSEFGQGSKNVKALKDQIGDLIKKELPHVRITAAKVMVGTMLVTTLYLSGGTPTALAEMGSPTQQVNPNDIYTVQPGDSLSVIAKRFNVSVTSIMELNGLSTSTIFVGQNLRLPFFTYKVVSGDSLSVIAKRFNTTIAEIRTLNQLQSDQIFVGQQMRIPQLLTKPTPVQEVSNPEPEPPTGTDNLTKYTVVSGDSLSVIAKKHNTTVEQIRSLNGLTSDIILVGQILTVPTTETTNPPAEEPVQTQPVTEEPLSEQVDGSTVPDPVGDTTDYRVVSGDSLSLIAKKFNTSVLKIKEANNLTSDVIFIGQKLVIPIPKEEAIIEEHIKEPVNQEVPAYTVVSGDSLSVIAKRFHVTVDSIKTANHLTSDIIFIGQKLVIPIEDPLVIKAPVFLDNDPINKSNSLAYPVKGTVNPGSKVEIVATDRENHEVKIVSLANEHGEFLTYMNLTTLKDGEITITAKAVDSSGNASGLTEIVVPKDTMIQQPTIDEPLVINSENAQNYNISGVAKPGASVFISVSDGVSSEIKAELLSNEVGDYKANLDLSSLNDGKMKITVMAVDAFGNESTTTEYSVSKDTSTREPLLNFVEQVTNQNVDAYQIFGVAEPGADIEITVSDGVNPEMVATALVNEHGEFKTTMDLRDLNDGELTVSTRALDQYKNRSEGQKTSLIKETSIEAPALENTELVNRQNQLDYHIFGRAQPNATVDIVVSDGQNQDVLASTVANANGEYFLKLDLSSLEDTELLIMAVQTSKSGVTSETSQVILLKDTIAPKVPVLHNNHFINKENQSNYLLSGLAEAQAQIKILITNANGQQQEMNVQADAEGNYQIPVDLTNFNDGDISFELTQQDGAGNISPISKKTLSKDTVAPNKIILDSLPTVYSGNYSDYTISGKTEPNSTLDLSLTDGVSELTYTVKVDAKGNFEIPIDTDQLRDGELELSLISTDEAGNKREPLQETLVKDTTGPTEVDVAPFEYVNSMNSMEFPIRGSSDEEGATVAISITDGETTITKKSQVLNGGFNTLMDLSLFEDGRLSIEIIQTDSAGNKGIVQVGSIEKDTIAETPTVSKNGFRYSNQQSIYTVVGTAEANATVELILSSQNQQIARQTTKADAKGFYIIDVNLETENTTTEMDATITQTDVAGNTSEGTSVSFSHHTVSEGESLYTIAKRYNTTVEAIKTLNQLTNDVIQPNQTLRLPVTASEVINLGYMYFGNTKEYINTVNQTGHSMNIVSPSYFDINPNGTLKLTYQVDPEFIETMHQQGIRVVPFLSNHWNREVGRAMLANKELAAQQIADAIERYHLDGVNIDIENVTDADRDDYTEFVRLLRQLIPAEKEVSVAVAANPNGWETGWHGSYDYTNLAKYADYLMIMSYDESFPGGEAGPVASAGWVEKSIQYALDEGVPNEKVVLGIAHYGRYWMEGSSYGGFGISNWQVEQMIKTYDGTVVFDEASKTPKAIVTIEKGDPVMFVGGASLSPGTYEIWYENEESIRQKLSLVGQYNIRGVGNWSVGQEDPSVWNSYSTTLPTTVPVSSTLPGNEQSQPIYTNYRVVAGDNLWGIAQRNQTTIPAIKELNNLTSDMLYVGQLLKIPVPVVDNPVEEELQDTAESPKAPDEDETTTEEAIVDQIEPETNDEPLVEPIKESTPEPKTQTTYTVAAGDSLSVIAVRFNTTVTGIKQANNLEKDTIFVGQTLLIPTTSLVENNEQQKQEPVAAPTTYIVVSGDSLSVIAKRFNTTVTAIKQANHLTQDIIYIGQKLVIP